MNQYQQIYNQAIITSKSLMGNGHSSWIIFHATICTHTTSKQPLDLEIIIPPVSGYEDNLEYLRVKTNDDQPQKQFLFLN